MTDAEDALLFRPLARAPLGWVLAGQALFVVALLVVLPPQVTRHNCTAICYDCLIQQNWVEWRLGGATVFRRQKFLVKVGPELARLAWYGLRPTTPCAHRYIVADYNRPRPYGPFFREHQKPLPDWDLGAHPPWPRRPAEMPLLDSALARIQLLDATPSYPPVLLDRATVRHLLVVMHDHPDSQAGYRQTVRDLFMFIGGASPLPSPDQVKAWLTKHFGPYFARGPGQP
jgi:hypothetical protein